MTNTHRHPLRSVLVALAARTAVAALVAGAVALTAHHSTPAHTSSSSVELAAYVAPDVPGCVSAYTGQPGEDTDVYYCDQYAVDTVAPVDPVADCLVAAGFHGRPDDSNETIYATSDAIESCVALVEASSSTPAPVGDLDQVVAVTEVSHAPADLVACWLASGARHDQVDGPDTLTASRLVIDACNPLGWVGA
jgi:hypothetical protein